MLVWPNGRRGWRHGLKTVYGYINGKGFIIKKFYNISISYIWKY